MNARLIARPLIGLSLFSAMWIVALPARANDRDATATLQQIVQQLQTISDQLNVLENRVSRLEHSLTPHRIPRPVVEPTWRFRSGRYRVDRHGFLYTPSGRRVGIWGVDAALPVPQEAR